MPYVLCNERYNSVLGVFMDLEKVLSILSDKKKFEYYMSKEGDATPPYFLYIMLVNQEELEDLLTGLDDNFQIIGHKHTDFKKFYDKVKNGATWEDLEDSVEDDE